MKQISIFITLIILIHSPLVFAEKLIVDGTSQESFTKSLSQISNTLSKDDQIKLLESYYKIGMNVDVAGVLSEKEILEKRLRMTFSKLHGKSFEDIILMAKDLPSNAQIEQAIKDFKNKGTSEDYQRDADIVRLQDINSFGQHLAEYFKKTGRYPLQGKTKLPIYVFLATTEQQKYTKPGPDYPHEIVSLKELLKDMESVLDTSISVPFDPQRYPDSKPNFYIYKTENLFYNFAVNVHHPFSFARKITDNFYKVEISNYPNLKQKIFTYDTLVNNEYFQTALKKKIKKPDFFKRVRENQQNMF